MNNSVVDHGTVLTVLHSIQRGEASWDVIGYNGITEADYAAAYSKLKSQGAV